MPRSQCRNVCTYGKVLSLGILTWIINALAYNERGGGHKNANYTTQNSNQSLLHARVNSFSIFCGVFCFKFLVIDITYPNIFQIKCETSINLPIHELKWKWSCWHVYCCSSLLRPFPSYKDIIIASKGGK